MAIVTYLFFNGQCAEALDFYAKTFGGKVLQLHKYGEAPPDPSGKMSDPAMAERIMHGQVEIGGTVIMASDDSPEHFKQPQGFSLSTNAPTPEEAERLFNALSAGGQVNMPLQETFFAKAFAMLTDRFGINWMVICEKPMGPKE